MKEEEGRFCIRHLFLLRGRRVVLGMQGLDQAGDSPAVSSYGARVEAKLHAEKLHVARLDGRRQHAHRLVGRRLMREQFYTRPTDLRELRAMDVGADVGNAEVLALGEQREKASGGICDGIIRFYQQHRIRLVQAYSRT